MGKELSRLINPYVEVVVIFHQAGDFAEQVQGELRGPRMQSRQVKQVEQYPGPMRQIQRRKYLHWVYVEPYIVSDFAVILRISAEQQLSVICFQPLLAGSKRRTLIVEDIRPICCDCRVAIAVNSAHKIIFFVVAGTVGLIKQAEALQYFMPN